MSNFLLLLLVMLFLLGIHGTFLFNPDNSAFIVLRHIRLATDNEQYRIRCPYNFNHLTVQLLNYSTDHCFNLYSGLNHQACANQQSPCQFHAKSVQLHCDHHSYSNAVDITYQCSHKQTKITYSQPVLSDSLNQDEILSLFLVGLGIVITISIFTCCIWFICCQDNLDDDDDNDQQKNSSRSLSLHLNPLESNRLSSLRTIQSV